MKKLTSLVLLLGLLGAPVALASLAGCGAGNEEQAQVRPTPVPQPPVPPTPEPKPTTGPDTGDPPPSAPTAN